MSKQDLEKIRKANEEAVRALRPHFHKLVALGAKKDHIWWDLMEALDHRKGRKPCPSWLAQQAARDRAQHARDAKAEKHDYETRNEQIRVQFERSLELEEKPAEIHERLARIYKLSTRQIRTICRVKE
jgi:hypothetical protein